MKITYNPCVKKKYSTDNFGILQVRRTENRKSTYFSLGVSIKVKDLLKSGLVSSTHSSHKELNKKIEEKILELRKKDSPDEIIVDDATNDKVSFIQFFKSQLDDYDKRKEIGTYKVHLTSFNHLKTFLDKTNRKDFLFIDLTSSFIRDFDTYLIDEKIAINTRIKYIKKIKNVYNKGVEFDKFVPIKNPFLSFKTKSAPVNKITLGKKDIETILKVEIEKKDPLYNCKNYFIFQIFAQGIRVSDLMTLRWGNLITGEILFYQFKTKKPHKIPLNFIILLRLSDYFLTDEKILNKKFDFTINNVDYKLNYREVEKHYQKLQKESIFEFLLLSNSTKPEDKQKLIDLEYCLNQWLEEINKIKHSLKTALILEIVSFAKSNPNKFIFPILDNKMFEDVKFNSEKNNLTKYQYNQMSSKTAYYNKQLKKLQEKCGSDVVFTSHLARHSYTGLMIETTNKDIYTISKTLGHSSLSMTEHYVSEFLWERIEESNESMNDSFLTVY
ncbi:tyrosine-type recombinase/integrase [Flavobacterium johnsoniae]|uniref:Phage integrase family protein n=1 Tax=Flavobacterium johnsoniae TaxID=986 RepID=A0A1M5TJA1_FLAJO|nr:site-specific integrase [Flavobacterium johnsoniae]SHH50852.1 Phage integrase family protein [Flavobacterium johnsoniae]